MDSGTAVPVGKGKWIVGSGTRRWRASPGKGISYYAPDFFLKTENPWFTHEKNVCLNAAELKKLFEKKKLPSLKWASPYRSPFYSGCFELEKLFKKTALQKAVPYIFETAAAPFDRENFLAAFNNLLTYAESHPLFVYAFWGDGEGMAGASPEPLFEMAGDRIATIACAGTRSKEGFNPDEKELLEHRIVVEGILEALKKFGEPKAREREERAFPHLFHLVTPIFVDLKGAASLEELIGALHPTAALGGYPKGEAQQWLLDYQTKVPRGRFGAPFGYYDAEEKKGCFIVAIRSLQWSGGELRLGAGCGVVEGSDPEKEWEEVQCKLYAVKQMLGF